uniref:F-box domain-containing protein n=1 Tax=Clytia hemisphaerica TaxID=252671 RepID=A0A7M5V837_9CNID
MDINLLPDEILEIIIAFSEKEDAKALSRTSKRMYNLTIERIWSKPRFYGKRNHSFLTKITKFPIKELHTNEFNCLWSNICDIISGLDLLHIDNDDDDETFEDRLDDICEIAKPPIVLHTNALNMKYRDDFNLFLNEILGGACSIRKLIINHKFNSDERRNCAWSPKQLEMVSEKVFIEEILSSSLSITDFDELVKVLCKLKGTRVNISETFNNQYILTVEDLDKLASNNIKVFKIDCVALEYGLSSDGLTKFAPVLSKFQSLEEFSIRHAYCQDPIPIQLFIGLPLITLSTTQIRWEAGKIAEIVKLLSEIKTLTHLDLIKSNHSDYKLSLADFELFKILPVVMFLELEALDLTKKNVPEFRNIMLEMKIEDIYWSSTGEYSNFDISLKSHGPDDYKTI